MTSMGLTIDESLSIILYTTEWKSSDNSLYKALNAVLRSKNRKELPPWFLYLKLLFTGLSRLQSISKFLFRGIPSDLHGDYPTNQTVTWWGFSSCTRKISVLEDFLGTKGVRTIFIIDCKSGKDISCFSKYPNEEEVLLLPETQFKVVSSLPEKGAYIIQLEEIQSPLSLPPPVPAANGINTPPYNQKKFDLNCSGQACDTCGKCRDWPRNGNCRQRVNGATCKHRFDPSNHTNGICNCT